MIRQIRLYLAAFHHRRGQGMSISWDISKTKKEKGETTTNTQMSGSLGTFRYNKLTNNFFIDIK